MQEGDFLLLPFASLSVTPCEIEVPAQTTLVVLNIRVPSTHNTPKRHKHQRPLAQFRGDVNGCEVTRCHCPSCAHTALRAHSTAEASPTHMASDEFPCATVSDWL